MPKLKYFEGMKMMNGMMKMNGDLDDMGMQMSLNQMDMNVVLKLLELYRRKEALKVNLGWIILNNNKKKNGVHIKPVAKWIMLRIKGDMKMDDSAAKWTT
jgi:hypothetical protein